MIILSTTKRLERDMAAAESYEEWREAAVSHDKASGVVKWQRTDESRHFDYVSIRRRLRRLRRLRVKGDVGGILFELNQGVHGNIDGMGHPRLYQKARFGTKKLITDYVDEVVAALHLLASSDHASIDGERLLDFFRRARHCNGCTALMMSGAGSLAYFHAGVAKTLWQHDLLPAVLSGSSGGAHVASVVSTNPDNVLEQLFEPENLVHEIEREQGLFRSLGVFMPDRLTADEVWALLERVVPDLTFLEAYELTGRHLNISIAAAEKHQTSRLLNAITTPDVYIREAVMASSAVPGFFPPVALTAKDIGGARRPYLPSRRWVDGSVSDDLPAKRLGRLYGANHFVVSQVNPHVVPFVIDTQREKSIVNTMRRAYRLSARVWLNATASALEKPLAVIPPVQRLSNVALGIINQDYVGDINILPDRLLTNPLKWLAHRTVDEIADLVAMGERVTWPKIEQIRIQTRIGRTLDELLRKLEIRHVPQEARLVASAVVSGK